MLSSLAAHPATRARETLMNHIHPTAIVADEVQLGDGNVIGPYAVLLGPLQLGDANWIGPHVVLGTPAEIRGIDHGGDLEAPPVGNGVRIGNHNVLREYTTIHQGHYATTVVGDDCYLMNKVYVGHDGEISDAVTMASTVTLGGHVRVGRGAHLGMGATVHQRRVIGPLAMVGMGAVVTADIPPYALAYGNPCRVHGANRVGMQRAGLSETTAAAMHAEYVAGRTDGAQTDPATARAWQWWKSTLGEASQ